MISEVVSKMEEWRTCQGFDWPYEVSSLGKIRSLNYNKTGETKELSQTMCGEYLGVSMDDKRQRVHRIVAQAFLPNPNNFPEVDHRNRNKLDNRVENLQWVPKYVNAINRAFRGNKVGEQNITLSKENTYRVDIRRQNITFRKTYKTLEEAIEARNKYLLEV